jgi:N-acetylneuraminate synthase
MSDWTELDAAVAVLRAACPVTVLQCSSVYPAAERVGRMDPGDGRAWGLPVGYSDHAWPRRAIAAAASARRSLKSISRFRV